MLTAKELIRNKTFLDVANRSTEVGGGQIMSFSQSDNIIEFQLTGLTGVYNEYIKVISLDGLNTSDYTLTQLTDIISTSHLEVACTCPAYLYWGFQYISAIDGYGLWIASISPDIRNPNLQGKVCKHLFRILSNWDAFAAQIANLYPFKVDIGPTIRRPSNNSRKERIKTLNNKISHGRHNKR